MHIAKARAHHQGERKKKRKYRIYYNDATMIQQDVRPASSANNFLAGLAEI